MSWEEEGLQEMNRVLAKAQWRYQKGKPSVKGEPTEWADPSVAMGAMEERVEQELAEELSQMVEQARQAGFHAYREYHDAWMEWLFAEGPNPLAVMRRLFCYMAFKDKEMLWNMGVRDLGQLFGVSHGAIHAQMRTLFGSMPAAWRKGEEARRAMAEAQKGNRNRNGGQKKLPGGDTTL